MEWFVVLLDVVASGFLIGLTLFVLLLGHTARTIHAVGKRLTQLRDDPEAVEAIAGRQLRVGDAVVYIDDWVSRRRGTHRRRGRCRGS